MDVSKNNIKQDNINQQNIISQKHKLLDEMIKMVMRQTEYTYEEAKEKLGEEFEEALETHDVCSLTGHGGTCGV